MATGTSSLFAVFGFFVLFSSFVRGQNDLRTYRQIVDHNNPQSSGTWNQRYWSDNSTAQQGGPFFLMLGGEGEASAYYGGDAWTTYGKKYGATTAVLEHRFYGPQGYNPTTDNSVSTLQRLFTSEQALADAATFIPWFQSQNGLEGSQVVVFGGSYPGSLAAWFREKYPNIANVAVASSSPLEATTVYYQGMAYVERAIKQSNENCHTAIVSAIQCAQDIINGNNGCSQSVNDSSELPNAFGQGDQYDFSDPVQKDQFFFEIMWKYYSNYPGSGAQCPCKTLVSEGQKNPNDPIAAYSSYLKQLDQGACTEATQNNRVRIGENMRGLSKRINNIQSVGDTDYGGWTFQLCNEFSFQFTSTPGESVFGYEFSTNEDPNAGCPWLASSYTAGGVQENVDKTNANYEGQEYDGTCTIFVTGTWDPWSALSINATNSDLNSLVKIPHSEHCGDMEIAWSGKLSSYQQNIESLIGQYLQNSACGSGGNSTGI